MSFLSHFKISKTLALLLLSLLISFDSFGAQPQKNCSTHLSRAYGQWGDISYNSYASPIFGGPIHKSGPYADGSYRTTGLSRSKLNKILGLPTGHTDQELFEITRPLSVRDNPYDPIRLFRRAVKYVLKINTVTSAEKEIWPSLAEKRYSYMRDLLTRISKISRWSARDYYYKTGHGQRTFVFEGKLEEILVIRGSDGAMFRGLSSAIVPGWSNDFFKSPQVRSLE
jgi:hypothetical protein